MSTTIGNHITAVNLFKLITAAAVISTTILVFSDDIDLSTVRQFLQNVTNTKANHEGRPFLQNVTNTKANPEGRQFLQNVTNTKANPEGDFSSSVGINFSSLYLPNSVQMRIDEKSWMENGVIYRPTEKKNHKNEKNPSPKLASFEPLVPFNKTLFFSGSQSPTPSVTKKKIILWYEPVTYTVRSESVYPLRFCPDFPCSMTTNKKYFNESSLLVFNGELLSKDPPLRASSDQLFMFHNVEAPTSPAFRPKRFSTPQWRSAFNWTMDYRTDSTFPIYYGVVRRNPNPPTPKNYTQVLLSKSNGTVAWMVSNCGTSSKRDQYVKELKKHINVDIYGGCGSFKCDRKSDESCNNDIATKYKFFLAFENSLCPDYVTEKFFRFMSHDIITVSRTFKGILDIQAAPGTYIDTNNYSSPAKLAEYLNYLDKNDTEYLNILREKDKYIYVFEDWPLRRNDGSIRFMHYHWEAVPFCQVCQRLWNLKANGSERVDDILKWFDSRPCVKPTDLG